MIQIIDLTCNFSYNYYFLTYFPVLPEGKKKKNSICVGVCCWLNKKYNLNISPLAEWNYNHHNPQADFIRPKICLACLQTCTAAETGAMTLAILWSLLSEEKKIEHCQLYVLNHLDCLRDVGMEMFLHLFSSYIHCIIWQQAAYGDGFKSHTSLFTEVKQTSLFSRNHV